MAGRKSGQMINLSRYAKGGMIREFGRELVNLKLPVANAAQRRVSYSHR
jgi:hypothetical protein